MYRLHLRTKKTKFLTNLRKKLKEHRYASTYPPFEPSPYEMIFINHTTTENTLIELNDAIIGSDIFHLDTKSTIILYQPNKPSRIQFQIITWEISSIIALVEVCHLPHRDQPTFQLIQELLHSLFQPTKTIFIWRTIKELVGFIQYGLFTKDQIKLSTHENIK